MQSIFLSAKVNRSQFRYVEDSIAICELTVEFQYERQKILVREGVRVEVWNNLGESAYNDFPVDSLVLVYGRLLVDEDSLVIRAHSIQPAYPNQSLNRMTIVGHTGGKPELKDLSDRKVASFHVALNRHHRNQDVTDWYRLECWNRTAEIAHQYIDKGSLVGAVGQLNINRWVGQEDGKSKMQPVIRVERLDLLSSKKNNNTEHSTSELTQPSSAVEPKVKSKSKSKPKEEVLTT